VIWSAVLSAQGDASPKSLFDAVLNSVKAAEAAKIRSIAFPPLAAPTMPEDEAVGTICEALRMTDSFVRAVVVRPR
jgi:O-acetyl-ADP-ribose deacetylase (regulator of RNase III)